MQLDADAGAGWDGQGEDRQAKVNKKPSSRVREEGLWLPG